MSERANGGRLPVSVVIGTYNRPASCRAAVESVLAQSSPPLEVVVCDDGSPPAAARELAEWCETQPTVRYHRVPRNRGRPALTRNAGVSLTTGPWLAFLDDDDRWLPAKLERQWRHASTGRWDVVAGDAVRAGGGRYFDDEREAWEPTYADLAASNPVILSTALVRRALFEAAGGFAEQRAYQGIEDYALWLALGDRGARFLVLGEPLAHYDDVGEERLSTSVVMRSLGLSWLAFRRWLALPNDPVRTRALHTYSRAALHLLAEALRRRAG